MCKLPALKQLPLFALNFCGVDDNEHLPAYPASARDLWPDIDSGDRERIARNYAQELFVTLKSLRYVCIHAWKWEVVSRVDNGDRQTKVSIQDADYLVETFSVFWNDLESGLRNLQTGENW